ncbi:hypothetical protein GY45DRAFT_1262378 [Cubamyces sp. BRFM 1775]|nr:hypothetical protein GY45DRAFT_1262378 [Cubamyces sp. BRFM 1775]
MNEHASDASPAVEQPIAQSKKRARKGDTQERKEASRAAHKIRKLVPPRPFPTVPTSVSATGPRSAHTEGKNYICVTRRTELGAYLRRCKDVFLKDGYKTLHLSAMGAAIPHLMQLALSLPPILPYSPDEIHTEVKTGTVEVQDELIPEDEDGDISYRTRGKSTISVIIKVGDGVDEPAAGAAKVPRRKNNVGRAATGSSHNSGKAKGAGSATEQLVYREDDMEET